MGLEGRSSEKTNPSLILLDILGIFLNVRLSNVKASFSFHEAILEYETQKDGSAVVQYLTCPI